MFALLKEFLIFTEFHLGALDRLLVVLDDAVVRIVYIDSAGLLVIGSESGQLANLRHLLVRLIGNDQTGILGIVQRLLYDLQFPQLLLIELVLARIVILSIQIVLQSILCLQ